MDESREIIITWIAKNEKALKQLNILHKNVNFNSEKNVNQVFESALQNMELLSTWTSNDVVSFAIGKSSHNM